MDPERARVVIELGELSASQVEVVNTVVTGGGDVLPVLVGRHEVELEGLVELEEGLVGVSGMIMSSKPQNKRKEYRVQTDQ